MSNIKSVANITRRDIAEFLALAAGIPIHPVVQMERLSEITGRRLDLIPKHELNPHLRETILREAMDL